MLTRGNSRETKSVPKLLLPWLRASPCYQLSFFWLCRLKTGPWFNIKMSSYQFRKSHCEDKTILRSYYLHNGISYTDKMISLYWISPLVIVSHEEGFQLFMTVCTILVSRNDRKRKNTSWSYDYRKTSSIKRTKYQNLNDCCLVLQLNLLNPLKPCVNSQLWRCSWSSANRRCSNYIWVINKFIAY